MQSQNMYKISRIVLEEQKEETFITGTPEEIKYKCVAGFDPAFSLFMPIRIPALVRGKFRGGFSLANQNCDIYDIIFIYEGSVTVTSGDVKITAGKNDALLLSSQTGFRLTQNEPAPLELTILRNSGFLAQSYYQLITEGKLRTLPTPGAERMDALFDKIVYYMRFPTNHNNVLVSNVMSELFAELYTSRYGGRERDDIYGHPKWFVKTTEYIEQNFSSEITVADLAANAFMSESRFYREFRRLTGVSPYQYLTRARIDAAKTLISTTDRQIKDIARSVGYGSLNHFIGNFKSLCGVTPSDYRTSKRGAGMFE